jgi:hypothetical protein
MYKTIMTIALIALVGCETTTNTSVDDSKEVSETRSQIEYLSTQCNEDNEIDLTYQDVTIISITHWTGEDLRQQANGYRESDNGLVFVAGCGEDVEVTYMYR